MSVSGMSLDTIFYGNSLTPMALGGRMSGLDMADPPNGSMPGESGWDTRRSGRDWRRVDPERVGDGQGSESWTICPLKTVSRQRISWRSAVGTV